MIKISEDIENKKQYAAMEAVPGCLFDWYRWDFSIDPDLDCVGEKGDGIGTLYFRLFVPETEEGKKYPVVLNLGGLGSANAILKEKNGYAFTGSGFASSVNQKKNPSYVLTFSVPYEACVSYEAELLYVYQFGEIAKWVNEKYGNVDEDRIYATGLSQGAGWSYELASVQPDLLAAALINAGTLIHTTWGDECDARAIAGSDVNLYIWHGLDDIFIPVNEACRAYNTLTALGKKNVILDIDDCAALGNPSGHTNPKMYSSAEITPFMQWLYDQKKGVPCTDRPERSEEGEYRDYKWAGQPVFRETDICPDAGERAGLGDPEKETAWKRLKTEACPYAEGSGGTGKIWLSKVRIGDETATAYDDAEAPGQTVTIRAGDCMAVTVQGYTGAYGDDMEAFLKEWSVDWAVLKGSVTDVRLTSDASPEPLLRPASVNLANGGGPNVNNSLYNENTLDGRQVYVRIDTAEKYEGHELKVGLRFRRKAGFGETASYYHLVSTSVE